MYEIAVGQLELSLFSFLINPMVVGLWRGGGRKDERKSEGVYWRDAYFNGDVIKLF